jgi:hypothetical protein
LTFDTTPTTGSANPVTSGGVKTALDAKLSRDEAEKGFTEWTSEQAKILSASWSSNEWTFSFIENGSPIEETSTVAGAKDAVAIDITSYIDATRTRLPTMADLEGKAPSTNIQKAALASDVQTSLGKADTAVQPSALAAKLDSTSAAPAFSDDSSVSYAVGAHVTYNGKLYVCTTATTGGTWVAASWTADTMTDPDAVLDITSQNQLRVVAKDGTLLWAQGYDLASTSSATLACDAVNNFTFADGATTQAFALPAAPTGKVGDFGLDIDNSANTGAATISFADIANNTASVVIPKGENLNDMLAIAAGELARFYITLSTFRINNLPTWHIVKQVVENGGAQS